YSGGGGNPRLRPYQAWAFDLNFEKYFATKGYVALQLFYKKIDTYIAGGFTSTFDYAGFPPVSGPTPPSTIGYLFSNVNTHGGEVYGAEFAG
ncbi:TonB-dependent receptor domain-containing protein, partial [Enterococcus faecium]|uniref:TonB-dependent receptor domain-containing protein n=2 Tax=Bacteria TaxID=2 RepID=UPI003F428D2D